MCAATALAVMFFACACKSTVQKYDAKISELRSGVYAAESAQAKITAITGRRETPYILNGVSEAKEAYTVVTMVPAAFISGATYKYKLTCGDKTYEGEMMQHPFAESFSADIKEAVDGVLSLSVVGEGIDLALTLESVVPPSSVSADKALEVALSRLKKSLKDKSDYEIYLRLTLNPVDDSGGYYWYVSFVDVDSEVCAVLIDSVTCEIRAIRE